MAGEENNTDAGICQISQDYAYTIFSTFGAFWLPLSVIIIVYGRIFWIAQRRLHRRIRQRLTALPPLPLPACPSPTPTRGRRTCPPPPGVDQPSPEVADDAPPTVAARSTPLVLLSVPALQTTATADEDAVVAVSPPSSGAAAAARPETEFRRPLLDVIAAAKPKTQFLRPLLSVAAAAKPEVKFLQPSSGAKPEVRFLQPSSGVATAAKPETEFHQVPTTSRAVAPTEAAAAVGGGVGAGVGSTTTSTPSRRGRSRLDVIGNQLVSYRKCQYRRMRNSARMLGLIIGAFVLCWLPFFVLATAVPFCVDAGCRVPGPVASVCLWLGYSNSLLNPVIYAIWDRNFRRCFRRLARCDLRPRSGGIAASAAAARGLPGAAMALRRSEPF